MDSTKHIVEKIGNYIAERICRGKVFTIQEAEAAEMSEEDMER